MSGAASYHGGLAAEAQVALAYERAGHPIIARRWRGRYGGEIDLIARDGAGVIVIEVKHSATHARAAERLSPRQMQRIHAAAAEFIGAQPHGQLTELRFDLALVDQSGRIEIRENAFAPD